MKVFVDVIIQPSPDTIVLIERGCAPKGWAFPGGYVDEGEDLREAAVREAWEETALTIDLKEQFHTYTLTSSEGDVVGITTVFLAATSCFNLKDKQIPIGGDDALSAIVAPLSHPQILIPHHQVILEDFQAFRQSGVRPLTSKDHRTFLPKIAA